MKWRAQKARATVLAEAGATASKIAAWTGHKTLAEVEHYTREYDRMRAVMGTERDGNIGKSVDPVGKSA